MADDAFPKPVDTAGLEAVFTLDPDAWAPRKALFRIAHEYLEPLGEPITPQELYALLRLRGFRESTRRGVHGFHGFRVPPEAAEAPRLVPEHSATSYRAGDRSPAARKARYQPWAKRHPELMFLHDRVDVFTPQGLIDWLRRRQADETAMGIWWLPATDPFSPLFGGPASPAVREPRDPRESPEVGDTP